MGIATITYVVITAMVILVFAVTGTFLSGFLPVFLFKMHLCYVAECG